MSHESIDKMTYPNPRDCKHGRLARSCEICELERERDELLAENRRLVERAKALEARLAKYQVSIEAERERWHRGGTVSGRGPIKTLQAILEEPAPTLEGFDEAVVQVELLSQGSDKDAES